MKIRCLILTLVAMLSVAEVSAQVLSSAERDSISAVLSRMIEREVPRTRTNVRSVRYRRGCLTIETTVTLSYYPFREENVRAMYDSVRRILPARYRRASLELRSGGCRIEDYIPAAFRSSPDRTRRFTNRAARPLVEPLSRVCRPTEGLADAILPFGRVTDGISTRRRIYGAGSVRRCGRRARISFRRVS